MKEKEDAEQLFESIVAKIIETRQAKGITKKEMAERLGVHPASYGDMESGKIKFSVTNLFAVMKILELDSLVKEFLSVPDTKEEIKQAVREVIKEMLPEISKGISENMLTELFKRQLGSGSVEENSTDPDQ